MTARLRFFLPLVVCLAAVITAGGCGGRRHRPRRPRGRRRSFSAFVDDFLEQFARMNPSIAAGNGLHQHDDTLEDFSAAGIAAQIATWRQLRTSLQAIPLEGLTPDERVDHRIMAGLIDGWLLDLDTVKSWQKNLMVYASAVSSGVHNLMTMESSPAEVRARRIIAKVAGVPALLAAADANLADPPRVMAERGVRMFRGAAGMLRADVPLAFAGLDDAALKTSLVTATARRGDGDRGLRRPVRTRAAAEGRRCLRGRPGDARGALPGRRAHRPAGAAAAGHRRTRAGARRAGLHRSGGQDRSPAARARPVATGAAGPPGARCPGAGGAAGGGRPAGLRHLQGPGLAAVHRAGGGGRGAALRPRPGLDALVAAARDDAGEELLLHHRRPGRLGRRPPGRVAAEVQHPDAHRHHVARSDAGTLRAQPVHAQDAGQDPPHLDRPQPVSAAIVRTGRLGPLRRAAGARRRVQGRRPPLPDGAVERGDDAHLPADRRHPAAHRRLVGGRRGEAASSCGPICRRRRRARRPSAAPTTRPTAATSWASSRP